MIIIITITIKNKNNNNNNDNNNNINDEDCWWKYFPETAKMNFTPVSEWKKLLETSHNEARNAY